MNDIRSAILTLLADDQIMPVLRPDGLIGWTLTEQPAMPTQAEKDISRAVERISRRLTPAQWAAINHKRGDPLPSRATMYALEARGLIDPVYHWISGNLNLTKLGEAVKEWTP